MTRTARAAYPRAVIKDRSESRTGRDPSVRKSGAGHYNWGPLVDMIGINVIDKDMEVKSPSESLINSNSVTRSVSPQRQHEKRKIPTPEEVTKARMFRKNAFKANDIDLTAIARTSSAVLAPSPISPVTRRDSHDSLKQIPIHSV